jgi:hypothetical protein
LKKISSKKDKANGFVLAFLIVSLVFLSFTLGRFYEYEYHTKTWMVKYRIAKTMPNFDQDSK